MRQRLPRLAPLLGLLAACALPQVQGGGFAAGGASSDVMVERTFGGIVRGSDCFTDAAADDLRLAIADITGPRQPAPGPMASMKCVSAMSGGAMPELPGGNVTLPVVDIKGLAKIDMGQLFSRMKAARHGLRGASAVMKGDFRTAISEAAKVAPPDSDVGKALSVVNAAMSMVPAGVKT